MDYRIVKGKDGKEFFYLTAQSAAVTTSNDPEDLITNGGTMDFPFIYVNESTKKFEEILGDHVGSTDAADVTDVTIVGLDLKLNPLIQKVKLTGTTEVKLKNPFYRVNDIIPSNNNAFSGNVSVSYQSKGDVSTTAFATLLAGEMNLRHATYSPHKPLYIDKIELISGAEDIIANVIVYKIVSNSDSSIGNAVANQPAYRVPIKYIQFEKPAGVMPSCNCFEFKNPYCIKRGETLMVTVEEVSGTTVIRCNIEGHF